jgi:hypothetical protein
MPIEQNHSIVKLRLEFHHWNIAKTENISVAKLNEIANMDSCSDFHRAGKKNKKNWIETIVAYEDILSQCYQKSIEVKWWKGYNKVSICRLCSSCYLLQSFDSTDEVPHIAPQRRNHGRQKVI